MTPLSIAFGLSAFIPPPGIARPPHYYINQPKYPARKAADELRIGKNNNQVATEQGVITRRKIMDFLASVETAKAKEIADWLTKSGYRVSVNTVIKHLNKLIDYGQVDKHQGNRAHNVASIYWISEGE